jgi:transcriptional regulator with XRE-family HTH domain
MTTGGRGPRNGSQQAAWKFFGTELRRHREAAGLTQVELGSVVFISGGYVSQFEQAIRKPQLEVAKMIDVALRTGGFFGRMCQDLIDGSPYAEYFAHVVELERLATKISEFALSLVPGLLQTAEYARAVTLATNPVASDEYIEEKVTARMDRTALLKEPAKPVFWAVLHENVLRVPVGGPAVMARELDHIAALIRSRRILVQVIPYEAGAHASMIGMMKLMEFDDAPPTVYTEAVFSGTLLDEPALVKRAQETYDLLRAVALSPEASLTLIESAAEDYRQCASTS